MTNVNGELLRLVDSIRREKNIPRQIVLEGIEAALLSAARKHLGGSEDIAITIDPESGEIRVTEDGEPVALSDLGRIAAQTAKQVIIQKIREAERDALFDEYEDLKGSITTGHVQRQEGGAFIVNLGRTEGILPRSECIPGETIQPSERIRCVVMDVRKTGQRVKIVLSRTHPDLVRRLFELEVPEVADRTIEIKAMSREAGYRTKLAVSSIDSKVDCVGACVGVRGTRIKNIVEELGGEKIDIVRWNESLQVLIGNALKPAEIDDILLCPDLDRSVVLVREDQLSLAIGRRGQNVRLASRLVAWDIEIMTHEEYRKHVERASGWFGEMPGVGVKMVEKLLERGYLSYEDLSLLEPAHLTAVDGIGPKRAEEIIAFATEAAARIEREQPELATTRLRPAPAPAPDEGEEPEPGSEAAAVAALRKSLQDGMQEEKTDELAPQDAAKQLFAEAETPPVDEAGDESTDEPADELAEEPVQEAADQAADEATDETTEDVTDEPTDEPAEEAVDEPTDEPVDEAIDEPTDEPADEAVDEPTDEPTEEPAEGDGESVPETDDFPSAQVPSDDEPEEESDEATREGSGSA